MVFVGKSEGKRPLGRPSVDGRIILKWMIRMIELTQDRDRWRTLVTAVMNIRVSYNAGNLLASGSSVSC
jgi:hypothetical protein